MSLLQKSTPVVLYLGIASVASGAAALPTLFHSAVDNKTTVARAEKHCEAIDNGKKSASLVQHVGCLLRHGAHFGVR